MSRFFSAFWDKYRGKQHRATVADALSILGEYRVIGNVEKTDKLPYSRELLGFCAEHTEAGEEWVLFKKSGNSLIALLQKSPQEFSLTSLWSSQESWISIKDSSQYLLIDCSLRMSGTSGLEFERFFNCQKLFARIKPSTAAELLLALKDRRCKKYLPDSCHSGVPISGKIPLVGCYDTEGLTCYTMSEEILKLHGIDTIGTLVCVAPQKFPMFT